MHQNLTTSHTSVDIFGSVYQLYTICARPYGEKLKMTRAGFGA
jgi:hypothetical protein